MIESFRSDKAKNIYSGVPLYRVSTVCEIKPGTTSGQDQTSRYTAQLFEGRVDMPGIFSLSANALGYQIIWSDASGLVVSSLETWAVLGPLEAYVRSMYAPPDRHYLLDPTITTPVLCEPDEKYRWLMSQPHTRTPHWTVTYGDRVYEKCIPIHVAEAWGRRTVVFGYQDASGNFAVIKDTFRDDQRRFEEAVLLKHIHKNGTFPGIPRLLASGEIIGHDTYTIGTARPISGVVEHRTKKRIVMGSRGYLTSHAKSVKDLLMGFYDGIEGIVSFSFSKWKHALIIL